MNWRDKAGRRLRILVRGRRVEADLADEIRHHVELEASELISRGWAPAEARREAARRLGGVEQTKEQVRETRPLRWLEDLARDLAYARRAIRRAPGFTAAVTLSLSLGIGANTAIYGLLHAVLWRLLPIDRPETLYQIGTGYPHKEFRLLEADATVLAGAAAYALAPINVSVNGSLEPTAQGQLVSGGYFGLVGVTPALGRAIGAGDDRLPNGHPVAMLSDGYWARRFGRDPGVVGGTITLSGVPFTVIGVTPPGFTGVEVGARPDIFVPLMMQPTVVPARENLVSGDPGLIDTWLDVVARLRPGVTPVRATAALAPRVRESFLSPFAAVPTGNPGVDARLAALASFADDLRPDLAPAAAGLSDLREQFSRSLFILMGVVAILLVIACANTASLQLARAAARRREFATRLALGAGRWRLTRQLLAESVLLAGLGGLGGVLLAAAATRFLVAFMSRGRTSIALDVGPDLQVLAFTAAVSIATGILFGTVPAIRAGRIHIVPGSRGAVGPGAQFGLAPGRVLAAVQIALSVVLLSGAALFLRNLTDLNGRDAGFERDEVLVVRVEPTGSDQRNIPGTSARLDRIYRDLIARVEALPGVRSASLAQFTPTSRGSLIRLEARTPTGERIRAEVPMVYPGFFQTIGVPFVAGRDFTRGELNVDVRTPGGAAQPQVAIVNETFARRVWPGEPPLGKSCAGSAEPTRPPCTIVGVVRDSAYADFTGQIQPTRFQPFLQTRTGRGQMALYVRVGGPASSMIPAVRRAVAQADPAVPLFDIHTLADEVSAATVRQRLTAMLTAVFGGLALTLAAVGLYGLLAFHVTQRTSEIGVRIALGASRRDVVLMVMGEAGTVIAAGAAAGIAAGVATARLMGSRIQGLLFGLDAVDPWSIGTAAAVLVGVALVAAYRPARRAARVDPMVALRAE